MSFFTNVSASLLKLHAWGIDSRCSDIFSFSVEQFFFFGF